MSCTARDFVWFDRQINGIAKNETERFFTSLLRLVRPEKILIDDTTAKNILDILGMTVETLMSKVIFPRIIYSDQCAFDRDCSFTLITQECEGRGINCDNITGSWCSPAARCWWGAFGSGNFTTATRSSRWRSRGKASVALSTFITERSGNMSAKTCSPHRYREIVSRSKHIVILDRYNDESDQWEAYNSTDFNATFEHLPGVHRILVRPDLWLLVRKNALWAVYLIRAQST